MAPARPLDADSDSDSDAGSEASVTEVQLGLSDGPVEKDDAGNPLVSRIGGRPVSELPCLGAVPHAQNCD